MPTQCRELYVPLSAFRMKYSLIVNALLTSASAHTIFTQLHVNGVGQGHTKGVRVPVGYQQLGFLS